MVSYLSEMLLWRICCFLSLAGVEKRCYVVNVYSQVNAAVRNKLWENIKMSFRGFEECLWHVMGDFNVVRSFVERSGVSSSVEDEGRVLREDFNHFIEELELIDLPLLGRKFTQYRPNGSGMSRLDRFLLSESWLVQREGISQRDINKDVSDYCPIVLRCAALNWGPKPFRFRNFWLKHREFEEVVKRS